MKLLILTQYYPPEIGAPQNRLHELAVRLKAKGLDVEVLTALPNYPKMEVFEEYKKGKKREEMIDGIPVHRTGIYVSKSKGIIARLLNYFSFVWTSYWKGRKLGQFDYLMVESPPLFLGYSAMTLSRKLKAKLIFNVSDLWPESAEKLGIVNNKQLLKLAYNLERKCYAKSTLITGQTVGIVEDIKRRFSSKNVYWLPNGCDLAFYNPQHFERGVWRNKFNYSEDDFILFYGGILGHAQGLEVIVKAGKLLENNPQVKFVLQGAGPEKEKLLQLREELNVTNVYFHEPVAKGQMPQILRDIDAAVIPLKKLDLFMGAIPSKIFEALAMENPLILGVEGEAKHHFIDNAKAGFFYEPENAVDLAAQIRKMMENKSKVSEMGRNGRSYVMEVFNRDRISSEFMDKLNELN